MKRKGRLFIVSMILTIGCCLAGTPDAGDSTARTQLVFVGYPDPAEFLITEVLRRVGDAYEERNPAVRVKVERGLGYLESREEVLEGEATGMMISEMLNEPRAYQTQHSVSGAHATYELKMDKFLPVAARILRSRDAKLTTMRIGFVTDEISNELQEFLDFLSSKEAREAIADLEYVELREPAQSPERVREVFYKRQKVTLDQPILSY